MTIPPTILAKSKPVFKANPKARWLYATADGNYFLPEAKTHAVNYCEQNGYELYTINRKDLPPEFNNKKRTKTKK